MNGVVKSILSAAAEKTGIELSGQFSRQDLGGISTGRICMVSLRSVNYSPWIMSANGKRCGAEGEYSITLKFLGKNGNFGDLSRLSDIVDTFMEYLAMSDKCIIKALERSEVSRSKTLPRLECTVSAVLKIFMVMDKSDIHTIEEQEEETSQKLLGACNMLVTFSDDRFYAEKATYSSETRLYEQDLLTGEVYRAIAGSQPRIITLESSILPEDRIYFTDLISRRSGKLIDPLVINGTTYFSMVLTKGTVNFSNKDFAGRCVMIFKNK